MRVIINADDLGRNVKVNDCIEQCIREGVITSSTIMANGEAFDGVKAIVDKYPHISFGVHLCIDELNALTKPVIFVERGITDEQGVFIKGAIKTLKIDKALKKAVFNEWCAQINRIQQAGIRISHIDSHHHYHTIPALQEVLLDIIKKYGIFKVRLCFVKTPLMFLHRVSSSVLRCSGKRNSTSANKKKSRIQALCGVLNCYIWNNRMKKHFVATDFFCSYLFFYTNTEFMRVQYKNRVIELMCHPGHPGYELETKLLENLPSGIIKMNYNQLERL